MSENNEVKEPLNKNNKVPKLRFDKFKNDNFNCDILSQIATLSKGNGLSKDDLSPDGNKCILYGELYTRYLGYIDTIISKTKTILSNPKLSKSGDIIMPLSGETPTDISNSAVVPEDNVILGGDLLVITPKKNIDPLFLSLYLSNCKKKEIAKKSCGISIIHSHKEDIAKLTIYYPSLAEQYYISTFLKKLTKKIDIVLKKIDVLKKYKEGLIKKLIKSSSKEMKLSQLITVCEKTKLQSSYGKISGKYKFFINSSDEITKWSDDYIFDGEYLILNTGGTAFTNYVNNKFSAMSDCLVVKPNSEYSITIYYWLKAVEKCINEVGFQGTGLKHLDINWLLRQKVKIIEYDNKKLSNFNKELNSLIELNSLVLEKLKLIKNIFLNLMFI